MNILFLTQVLPYPLVGGQKIRAYFIIRYLAARHRVTLASFTRHDDLPEDIEHLKRFCSSVHVVPMERSWIRDAKAIVESYYKGGPIVIARDRIEAMNSLLERLVQDHHYDVIHADQTSMAMYALSTRDMEGLNRKPRIVVDQHNALYLVVRRQSGYMKGLTRMVWQREATQLASYEAELCRRFDRLLTVTENDKRAFLALYNSSERAVIERRITVIPICVDPSGEPMLEYHDEGPHVIHVGTMIWPPNVDGVLWFSNMVLPEVIRRVPGVRFTIVGKDPPSDIKELASTASPVKDQIEITGFISDLTPYLSRSRAFIVPVRAGGGMRVKIIDAWQKGIPVVSTTIGAEGLQVEPDANILLADDPREFADAVVRLFEDEKLAALLRANGRKTVERHYDYRKVYNLVDQVYADLEQP